jgi:hypothetical protein
MYRGDKQGDVERILVDVPLTDSEIFESTVTGRQVRDTRVELSRKKVNFIQNFARASLLGMIVLTGFLEYSEAGSIKIMYEEFRQESDKIPSYSLCPF